MRRWQIGNVGITQIVELTFEGLEAFLPDATPDAVLPIDWLSPHFLTPEGVLKFSIHALVIDTGERCVIVDTCVGNDKPREAFPDWDRLQTSFLDDLTAAGYPPERIDIVLCTHLHLDHVGWNTRLVDGAWVPTFPNARYLVEAGEYAYVRDEAEGDDVEPWLVEMNRAVMQDSIGPVAAAGLLDPVPADHRLCEEICLVPTPGHTVGHVSVLIESLGESALITGDFVHHPCQLAHPEWSVTTDYDGSMSVQTRERIFGRYAGSPTVLIGTHWPEPTAGRLVRDGDVYRLVVL